MLWAAPRATLKSSAPGPWTSCGSCWATRWPNPEHPACRRQARTSQGAAAMDETTLRTLLDSALADEPPIGPVADNALRAGIKIRRRRVLSAAAGMAVAAAIAIVIPVATGPLGAPPTSSQHPPSMTGLGGPANVPPPDQSVLRWSALAKDRASVVKITGDAPSCDRSLEGSGFVISPQHVLTNAHVVAGTTRLHVAHGTSKVLAAQVVLFDPNTDVAILYVPGLGAPPLRFAGRADWS